MSRSMIDALEPRRLLAAALRAAVIPHDLIDKVPADVWTVSQDAQNKVKDNFIKTGQAKLDSASRVQIDFYTSGNPRTLARQLKALGAWVTDTYLVKFRVAEAWLPARNLAAAARIAGVTRTSLPDYAVVNTVTSAGDSILMAANVRSQFAAYGIDGTGIKIGVISNGADHIANVGSELPAVTVDPNHHGSGDEGTAMMEIVHDLAPGAQLYFSGVITTAAMIPSIDWLVSQGCNVIVDDLSFFGESFFTNSDLATHVASVVANGVTYVTSAGNYSNGNHYQSEFTDGGAFNGSFDYNQFGTAGQNSDAVNIFAGQTLNAFLQWSDPWGGSGNDYNLYLYNSDTNALLDSSTEVQDGAADSFPFEEVSYTNTTGGTIHANLQITKSNSAATRELEMFVVGNGSMQFSTPTDALVAQEAVPSVISVAAAGSSNPNSIEAYSSQGGSTIYTDTGDAQVKSVLQTLDGTAIDGVQTDVGQLGFFLNPFFGTSAAAPHAAAIAALILQANHSLSPAQISQDMADTATDIGAAGYDAVSGAGLYNALGAVYKVFTPAAPTLDPASDSGVSSSDDITNVTSPTFDGAVPAGSFVRLFVDGIDSTDMQLNSGVTTYALTPSSPLTDGPHTIAIRVAASSSVALANNSNLSSSLSVTIDTVAPTLSSAVFNYNTPVQNLTFTFSESVAGAVQNTDLVLNNATQGITVSSTNIAAANSPNNVAIFTFPGYSRGALPNGKYIATLPVGSITDVAGNALSGDVNLNFFYLAGDFNHDGTVNVTDLGILASNWQGSGKSTSTGDANYDGTVDVSDLGILATDWQVALF